MQFVNSLVAQRNSLLCKCVFQFFRVLQELFKIVLHLPEGHSDVLCEERCRLEIALFCEEEKWANSVANHCAFNILDARFLLSPIPMMTV